MNLEQLADSFKELNALVEGARAQMKSDCRAFIEQAAQELFKIAPEIDHVYWTQYTPFFNDGEPCSFNVHDFYYVLEGEEDESYLYNQKDYFEAQESLEYARMYVTDRNAWFEWYKSRYKLPADATLSGYYYPTSIEQAQEQVVIIEQQMLKHTWDDVERVERAFESFYKCMQLIPDDIMEAVYGDHVRVTLSRLGTIVDEYHHD